MKGKIIVGVLFLFVGAIVGALMMKKPPEPEKAPLPTKLATGEYEIRFRNKSPLSSLKTYSQRSGLPEEHIKKTDSVVEDYKYKTEEQRFQIYVPADYKKETPYGLIVWISQTRDGAPPSEWRPIFDKQHLIYAAAKNAGENKAVWFRTMLALDAVHNLRDTYNIDPNRIFIAGPSIDVKDKPPIAAPGISVRTAMQYPDVFRGGLYLFNAAYFAEVKPASGEPIKAAAAFKAPPADILEMAKKSVNHVLVAVEKSNRALEVKAVYENGFKKDGFEHVKLLEFPPTPEGGISTENFAKAIEAMVSDAPKTPPTPAAPPADAKKQ